MNVRSMIASTFAAAAMMVPAKSGAQANKVLNAAQNVVVADTVKAAKAGAQDAKTVLLKKYNGHFYGNVKNGKIAEGNLQYTEAGKTMFPEGAEKAKAEGIGITIDAGVVSGKDMVNTGYRVQGAAQKGKDLFEVSGTYAMNEPQTDFIANASYTRLFPVNKDVSLTAKAGVEGAIKRYTGQDNWGLAWPQVLGGAKFQHNFNGIKVGAKAEAGVGASIVEKEHINHDVAKAAFLANGEIEAGINNVSAFISGGKDAIMGANIGGGLRINLK